ncbi:MAG: NAD(FAD)-utilizing dehydrogenase [Patescibacteria group bacterium]|nr:NAD(FAD)-utilizing dehydrogenase [Patescibacteria group bacterium]
MNYDVIVIGGGASGMFAATIASARGKRVLILEKNKKLGEKLKISGGGRCNITNAEPDLRKYLARYEPNDKFLFSAFSEFSNLDTFEYFKELNLPLEIEANGRAFPYTRKAIDVFNVLEKELIKNDVEIVTNSPVTKFNHSKGVINSVISHGEEYFANSFILATGGLSHPETGSTGDGFVWLAELGHTISDPTPSIVPLAVADSWIKSLSGTSFENAKIIFFVDGAKSFVKKGKILCTHFGLSGPTILNSAKQVGELLHEGEVTATIDIFPELDHGTLEKKIISIFDENKNKMLKNIFSEIVPPGTASAISSLLSEIDFETKVHSVSKEDRKKMVKMLKELPVTITGLMGFDRAVVADGGVPLEEIDTKTFRSKKVSNLFVTGDLLHINRPSGGFSLQLCWTTGFIAGKNA